MKVRHLGLGVAALAAVTLSIGAAAATQDVYKEREALMKGFGQRMTLIKGVVAGTAGTPAEAQKAAEEIAANAAKIPSVFPKGTNAGESEALPVIWDKWPEFEGKATNMQDLATKLAQAAGSGDKTTTLAAFGQLGQNGCGGCHENFRKKKS